MSDRYSDLLSKPGLLSPCLLALGMASSFFGLIVLAASMVFMLLLARRFGTFTKGRVREWRHRFVPNALIPLPTKRRRFLWMKRNSESALNTRGKYMMYEKLVPMTKTIFQQFIALTKSSTPIECVLLTTDPPTVKVTNGGVLPVVTSIENVDGLENFAQYYTKLPKIVLGTYHQHEKAVDMTQHDERIFQTVDSLLQSKLHIIAAAGKYRIYCAQDGPVFTAGRR